MNADERWFQGHLHELDARQCWESVRSREVARELPHLSNAGRRRGRRANAPCSCG